MKSLTSKLVVLLFGALLLTGCGFHLGPQQPLPAPLHTMYLETDNPYGSLASLLRKELRSSHVTLVDSAQAAQVVLQLSKPVQGTTNATIGPTSQARIYLVKYEVSYTLKDKHGKVLLGPRELKSTRNLVLNANQLLQSNSQLSNLYSEMEHDIVTQLYSQLRSEQVQQALSKTSS